MKTVIVFLLAICLTGCAVIPAVPPVTIVNNLNGSGKQNTDTATGSSLSKDSKTTSMKRSDTKKSSLVKTENTTPDKSAE